MSRKSAYSMEIVRAVKEGVKESEARSESLLALAAKVQKTASARKTLWARRTKGLDVTMFSSKKES